MNEALSRTTYYSDFARKDAEKEKEYSKKDARMKHGKNWKQFTKDVESAKERLKPGEVKRWDKEKKQWVSNKG
jgi:vacuolar-type H+-ATPase subunit E/Vma4